MPFASKYLIASSVRLGLLNVDNTKVAHRTKIAIDEMQDLK